MEKKSKHQKYDLLILPGSEAGQHVVSDGTVTRIIAREEALTMTRRGQTRAVVFCHAAVDVHVLSLILPDADEGQLREAAAFELKKRGLWNEASSQAWSCNVAERRPDGTVLVLAKVLEDGHPDQWTDFGQVQFAVAAEVYDLPPSTLTLLREGDRSVCIFCGPSGVVHYQALGGNPLATEAGPELFCVASELETRGICPPPQKILIIGDDAPARLPRFACPVERLAAPSYKIGGGKVGPVPPEYSQREQAAHRRQSRIRLAALIVGVYLVFLAAFVGQLIHMRLKVGRMESLLAADRVTVESIKQTAADWALLDAVVEPDRSPLEMLHAVTEALPAEGVRLTAFQYTPPAVIVLGEAKNAGLAYEYGEKIKAAETLSAYAWELPPPRLLPSGKANFQMEGRRR